MNEAAGEWSGGSRSATTQQLLAQLPSRWCLLRDTDATGGGELEYDVLVETDRREAQRVLEAAGAQPVRSWGRAPHRQLTWWDPTLGRSVRIDLVDELGFGTLREVHVDRVTAVLAGVTRRDGWPRPSPSNEQWLALLHGLLDRDRLRPRDIDRLDPWIADDDDIVAGALPGPLRSELVDAARRRDWPELEARRDVVRAALAKHDPLGATRRRWWRAAMRRTTKLQRAILRPGVRIALLGPDGAGKSTTIEALIDEGIVDSTVYLGVAPAGDRPASTLPGRSLLRTVRRLVGGWRVATVRRRRGESVALDRHPLEATIGPPTTRPKTRLRRWLLAHILPRPEVVVVLMAPADVLHARKPEHEIGHVAAARERYLSLAHRHGYEVIDTTQAPSAVVADIGRAAYASRRPRWSR